MPTPRNALGDETLPPWHHCGQMTDGMRTARASLRAASPGIRNSPSATTAVAAHPNRSATGAPSIQGVLQDLQVLTADTVGIIDADGTDCATFSYQWMRVTDGGSLRDHWPRLFHLRPHVRRRGQEHPAAGRLRRRPRTRGVRPFYGPADFINVLTNNIL